MDEDKKQFSGKEAANKLDDMILGYLDLHPISDDNIKEQLTFAKTISNSCDAIVNTIANKFDAFDTSFNEPTSDQIKQLAQPTDEDHVVELIKFHLLTTTQWNFLYLNDLTIKDLINGRYPINLSREIIEKFYVPQNQVIGKKVFIEKHPVK